MEQTRIQTRGREATGEHQEEGRCGYCLDSVQGSEAFACVGCRGVYHVECSQELDHCGTLGCRNHRRGTFTGEVQPLPGGGARLIPRPRPRPGFYTNRQWLLGLGLGVLVGVLLPGVAALVAGNAELVAIAVYYGGQLGLGLAALGMGIRQHRARRRRQDEVRERVRRR
jgi:hypothetical protein